MTDVRLFLMLYLVCTAALAQDGLVRLKVSDVLAKEAPWAAAVTPEWAPVGYIKTVFGIAFVVTQGKPVRANIGSPVMQGSVLKTGPDSSLGVTFKDSTMMSFGPETELKVSEYLYAPVEGKLRFGSQLIRGTLNYVSGVIAKLKPDGVTITTPTGMIGVRGTQFVAKVNPMMSGKTGVAAPSVLIMDLFGMLTGCSTPAKLPPRPFDYVVLLPNVDGTVGKVLVKGDKGEQVLDMAQNGASLNGDAAVFAVSTEQLQKVFGPAMTARPVLPEQFYLYFESGGANLTPASEALIPTILEHAKVRESVDVSVIGHTDTVGKADANASLAYRRANTVASLLRERGLQPDTLTIESHGESNLLVATPDETAEPRNRRVEITIR